MARSRWWKSQHNVAKGPRITGESAAGEGASEALDKRLEDNAAADDATNSGGGVTGKVKGKTLDMDGIPAGARSPTSKNDGDGGAGKKGNGKQLPDDESGADAQGADVQTLKSDDQIMKARDPAEPAAAQARFRTADAGHDHAPTHDVATSTMAASSISTARP